jgi:type I restriction enzyme S subunit
MLPVDWEVHFLGDEIAQLEAGVSVNSVDEEFSPYGHEQAILKTSAVSNSHFLPYENKKIAPKDIKRAKLNPRANSIIISRMNTLDLVGECGYVEKDYPNLFLPDRLWMTRFKRESKINVKWLSYLLNYKEYKMKIKESATGTSGSMKNISKGSLLSIAIPFPTPEEQTAIATVLTDMDAEIVALERRREKVRALKQGMMQELLTGKTRLL